MKTNHLLSIVTVTTALLIPNFSTAQSPITAGAGKLATSAMTGVLIDELFGRIQGLIDDATNKGDYLLVRAGIEARIALENFKLVNTELLDKAFSSLDQASRDNFARINSTVEGARAGTIAATSALQSIADTGQQIAIPFDPQGHRSFLIRYLPTVISPAVASPIRVSVKGVNLDEADATIVGKATYSPKSVTKQELLFEIPTSEMSGSQDRVTLTTLQFKYKSVKPGWWNRALGNKEALTRPISFASLPKVLARLTYTTTVASSRRITERRDYALEQFKGVDADQDRAIAPPPGWKFDLESFTHSQGRGEGNSYCVGFLPENRTEFGVVYRAHVGRIKNIRNPGGSPGFVNCSVGYTLYRDEPTEIASLSGAGVLNWNEDREFQLPPNLRGLSITLVLFDGSQQIQTNDANTKYYSLVKEPTRFLIRPKIPTDVTN